MTEIANLIKIDTVLLKSEMRSLEFLEAVLKYVLLHDVRLFRSGRLTFSYLAQCSKVLEKVVLAKLVSINIYVSR
jgi:hypothetical protein